MWVCMYIYIYIYTHTHKSTNIFDEGNNNQMAIIVRNGLDDLRYIQDGAVCISYSANTLEKCMHPIILPPAMGK